MQNPIIKDIETERRSKPYIICVDDEKVYLDPLKELLNSKLSIHFILQTSQSGEEALELLNQLISRGREVAILIADQKMPTQMQGDDFLIEAHKIAKKAIKIMLTGRAEDYNVGKAVNQANLYRFLHKTENDDILMTISEAAKSYFQNELIEDQRNTFKLLHKNLHEISSHLNTEKLLYQLLSTILEFSKVDLACMYLVNNNNIYFSGKATSESVDIHVNTPLDTSQAPAEIISFVTSQSIEINSSIKTISDEFLLNNHLVSYFATPLILDGKLLGILFLGDTIEANSFTDERLEIINILKNQATISLANARLHENLESMVEERTSHLSLEIDKVMSLNSHKDKMVQIVSHDIRSPLTGIAELAGFLMNPTTASDKEKVVKYAEIIVNETRNVVKLVNDILDVAKLESGTLVINKQKVDLTEYVKKLAQSFESQVILKKIPLKVELTSGLSAEIDESKLNQALSNFISNAFKFTKTGGEIKIRLTQAELDGKKYAKIEVIDNGLGIPESEIPKLFEKFAAKQRSGTSGEKGTGIGLSIAHQIITEHHNGKILVKSEVGVGTTFEIFLPL